MKVCPTCGSEWSDDTKFCPNDGTTLRSTSTADMVGSVIADRYHISKKLGEGGMGAVYLGEHVKMGRKSAIKVMTQAMANDPDAIARFNREAANAARINHPNVCAIYDFGETEDGLIYLAMEFIEGEALSDLMEREGKLPADRASNIILQAGEALQIAHDMGIVHRDLKPDNIMITQGRGGDDLVKVVDFGIAKAMGGEEGQKVTKTGLVVGTPEYMSPEQLSGDVLDGRSDIYSLALVLFRMLTGQLPFQADTAQETMIKRLTDDPLKLNAVLPGATFPAKLQAVLDKALQRMPSERYESAEKFGRDVVSAAEGMVSAPEPPADAATQLMDSAEIMASDPTEATMQMSAPAAEPAVPPTRVAPQAEEAPSEPTPDTAQPVAAPPPAPKKKRPMVAIAAAAGVLVLGGGTAAVTLLGGDSGEAPGDSAQVLAQGPDSVTRDTDSGSPGAPDSQVTSVPTGGGQPQTGSGGQRESERNDGGRETADPGDTDTPIETQPAGMDAAAVDAELTRIEDLILIDDNLSAAVSSGAELYSNQSLPRNQRAQAAYLVSQAFLLESEDDRSPEACTWIKRAITLDPLNSAFEEHRSLVNQLTECQL